MASLKNQLESSKNAQDVRVKDKKPLPGGQNKDLTKKSNKGCCGDAKCSIMWKLMFWKFLNYLSKIFIIY